MKKIMKRIFVTDIRHKLEGDLNEVIAHLQSMVVPGVKRTIDIEHYDDYIEAMLLEERLETDEECERRLDTEKEQAKRQREHDLFNLERLRKLYES